MRTFLFYTRAFFASLIVATGLASIFSTQFVIAGLKNAGAHVDMGQRISMTQYDLINMGPRYGFFILIGLAIAFLAAHLIHRQVKKKRPLIYILAGAACFIVMLYLMKAVFFGVPIIGGARSILGLSFQALAGGIAGYLFAKLTTPKPIV